MAAAAGVGSTPRYASGRAGEQRRSCIDATRAREVLGWVPRVQVAEGLVRTVESFREAGRKAA